MQNSDLTIDTLCAQADHRTDPLSGDVVPAVHMATTFARDEHGVLPAGLRYSRYGNPTVLQAEALLAKLDGAKEARLFGDNPANVRDGRELTARARETSFRSGKEVDMTWSMHRRTILTLLGQRKPRAPDH